MPSDTTSRILDAMRELTISQRSLPSMDAVARAAGISKGGLIHHFPSRTDLLRGLVDHLSVECADDFAAARESSSAARSWLETSTPESGELDSFFVLFTALQALNVDGEAGGERLAEFTRRTEAEMADELGGALPALVVRLVGDGLLLNALTGATVDEDTRSALIAYLTTSGSTEDPR